MKLLALLFAIFTTTNLNAEIYKCGNVYTQESCGADAVVIKLEGEKKNTEYHATPYQSSSSVEHIKKIITGTVVRVTDGDTITIKTLNGKEKIRFAQIDAPETSHFGSKSQPYGKEAGVYLKQLVMNKTVKVEIETIDQYGRNVGTVYLGNNNINRELVKNGLAWVYRQYSHDAELLNLEKNARDKKIGLWNSDNPIYPSDFRKRKNK